MNFSNDNKLILLPMIKLSILFCIVVIQNVEKKPSQEEIKQNNISSGSLVNFIHFPKEYQPKWHDANWLTVYLKYPKMLPSSSDISALDDSIRLIIEVENLSGTDKVKTFLKHVYQDDGTCGVQICYAWKVNTNNQFTHFRYGKKDDVPNQQQKVTNYYLFKAYDKQDVLLENSGGWSDTYTISRNIENYFLLSYQFKKTTVIESEIS